MSSKDCISALHPPCAHRVAVRPQEFRFRTRTPAPSYGLVFSLALFVLGSVSSLSAGQSCTPVFEGSRLGVVAQGDTPSLIKVIEGASFNLSCNLSRHHGFAWRLNSSLLTDGNPFKQSASVPAPGIIRTELYVTNISRNQSGEFTCVVAGCHSSSEPHHGLTVKVIYAEQPKILHPKRDNYSELIADIGSNLELRCESKEDVNEGVIWQRQNDAASTWENMETVCKRKNATALEKKKISRCYIEEKLENKTKVLTLFLLDMRQDDVAKYSCGIAIPDGSSSSEIEMKKNDFISVRAAGKAKQSRVKRSAGHGGYQRPPPKHEGINWRDPVPILDGPEQEKLKIVRRFEKGMNSTIAHEGDPVHLYCNLTRGTGEPTSMRYRVAWRFREKDYYGNELNFEADPELKGRYKYFENSTYTSISIVSANASDKGWYQCSLWDFEYGRKFSREAVVITFDTRLRIREKMAPLYPFVSICVEIVLVFLIILIYEKSKSKTEVDESDTDGSPDQKNVSDNGDGGGSEATRLAAKE